MSGVERAKLKIHFLTICYKMGWFEHGKIDSCHGNLRIMIEIDNGKLKITEGTLRDPYIWTWDV